MKRPVDDGAGIDAASGPGTMPVDAAPGELWTLLRERTQARVGLERAGNALATGHQLALRQAHAMARDAIHHPLDLTGLTDRLRTLGLGEPVVLHSAAAGRSEYLRRPDLGRRLAPGTRLFPQPVAEGLPRLAVVVVDGLSTSAVHEHAAPLAGLLATRLQRHFEVMAPVVVQQGRVAVGDEVGEQLDADAVLVLVGERPGLSVSDSLGAYLTWSPRVGLQDSERNCVSNIREPGGLSLDAAATVIARLLAAAHVLGRSGVHLKDVDDQLEA